MFCGKCGTQHSEEDVFCAVCGERLNNATNQAPVSATPIVATAPVVTPAAPAAKRPNKKLLIGIGVAAAVLIVALILIFSLGGDDKEATPESIASTFVEAFVNCKPANVLNVIPEAVVKEDIGNKSDRNEWVEMWEEDIDVVIDELNDTYDSWKISHKITDVENVDRDYLEEIQEYYAEKYDLRVSAAKEVTVKMTANLDGYKESDDLTVYVIQIKDAWYLEVVESDFPMNFLYSLVW